MKHFLTFTLVVLTLLSCGLRIDSEKEDTIIGVYCGMCQGSCFQGYSITNDSVSSVSAKYYDKLDSTSRVRVSPEEEKKVRDLLKLLPADINEYERKYGCPDCHDQCGVYISLKSEGTEKIILIDPVEGKHPKELAPFVLGIRSLTFTK
jgi:hypothetical protein